MKTSIASVTFRSKTIQEIVLIAQTAGLNAIEWGGDVHVPPGNREAACAALYNTKACGLTISAYGSYYRCRNQEDFLPVLETALLLETSVIRIWAGTVSSRLVSLENRLDIVRCLRNIVRLATICGCRVVTEYHADTLTDTLESTQRLLDEVPGLRTLWQPPIGLTQVENLAAVTCLKGQIEGFHVYHRDKQGACRPLLEGKKDWASYLTATQETPPCFATLEFVRDNSEQQFYKDALTLHQLLKERK